MKRSSPFSISLAAVAASISIFLYFSCGNENPVNPTNQPLGSSSSPATVTSQELALRTKIFSVMAIQNKHTQDLLGKEGVVGTATGVDANGNPVILVYAVAEKNKAGVPVSLESTAVVVEVTGEFHAYENYAEPRAVQAAAVAAVSHTARQTPPIQLGTSGGWTYDLANGYCCGGTLGSLITDGVNQYILSCYHVFQADIVLGGNNRIAKAGDPVIQPGLIDVNCSASGARAVATLSPLSFPASLPSSNVDASIAGVVSGMVNNTGAILEIGTISHTTVAAALGQAVKKSGRTTALTRSSISGLNATIKVAYDNECAGGSAFTKTFTGQIIIKNQGSKFLNSGDSGSLLVEDQSTNPRAIGLLFAGSSTEAVANPIGQVLSHFGPTFAMVGK